MDSNVAKTLLGGFYLDEHKGFLWQVGEGILRHTWEAPQQLLGYTASSIRNGWSDRVDFWGGATFVTNRSPRLQGFTLGSYINVENNCVEAISDYNSFDDFMLSPETAADIIYRHEFGHTIQSKIWGPIYLIPAACSLWSAAVHSSADHHRYWTEWYANTYTTHYLKHLDFVWTFPYE